MTQCLNVLTLHMQWPPQMKEAESEAQEQVAEVNKLEHALSEATREQVCLIIT